MKVMSFVTDAAAVAGVGAEVNSGAQQMYFPYRIRILALKQPAGAAIANDANWNLWVNNADTGYIWLNESLDPVNDGGVKLGPSGITIGANRAIQLNWLGQAVAQANVLEVYYEIF